jgi:hypothetical protein
MADNVDVGSRVVPKLMTGVPPATHLVVTVADSATLGVTVPAAYTPPAITTTNAIAVNITMYLFIITTLTKHSPVYFIFLPAGEETPAGDFSCMPIAN